MIALLDTSEDLDVCADELGCDVGQLLTPLTRFTLQYPALPWAIDNGAFAAFDERAFLSLLEREKGRRDDCLFVAVPDIVGSAQLTHDAFYFWKRRLDGWRCAYVCQDGQESVPIPWILIDAVFIGGSTAFKVSPFAAQIIKAAKVMGKWSHVGRVNDPARFEHFEELGADSFDGTGISRYSHMRKAIRQRHDQTKLFEAVE